MMRKRELTCHGIVFVLLVVGALPLAWARPQQKRSENKPILARTSGNVAQRPVPATEDPSYLIGAQDVLDISVWKEPEISRTVPVRPDGKISLPLLNDVQASGLTPMQLASMIATKLRKYITDPQVTVIVTETSSQRVYILGEVVRAGAYPLLPNMTVLQALSSAGGFTQFANAKKIYVLRNESGRQMKIPFDYKEVISGHRPEQNVGLKSGDTIIVP